MSNTKAATPFMRGEAKTDFPSPAEHRYMVARAGRASRALEMTLEIDLSAGVVHPLINRLLALESWTQAERARLELPKPQAKAPYDGDSFDEHEQGGIAATRGLGLKERIAATREAANEADRNSLASARLQYPLLGALLDRRSAREFDEELENYLLRSKDAFPGALERAYVKSNCGGVLLRLVNTSDRNFEHVEVITHFEGNVLAFDEENEEHAGLPADALPKSPIPYGEKNQFAGIADLGLIPEVSRYFAPPRLPEFEIDNGGSSRVRFTARHLRPMGSVEFVGLHVLLEPPMTDGAVTVSWTATATNVDGVASGSLLLPIGTPLDARDLLPVLYADD